MKATLAGAIAPTLSSRCAVIKMNCFVLFFVVVVVVPTRALSHIPCNSIDLQLALISANYTGL